MGRRTYPSGIPVTKSIVNGFSAGSISRAELNPVSTDNSALKRTLSGALTANTLKQIIAITGSGSLAYANAHVADVTSRTVRLQIILDGVTVFDATSNAITTARSGIEAVGAMAAAASGAPVIVFDEKPFNSSMEIWVASSLTETDKIAIAYAYETR